MKIRLGWLMLALLCAGIIVGGGPAFGQYDQPVPVGPQIPANGTYGAYGYGQYGPMNQSLGDRELRNLVAPIALYPDPLLAMVLPAATYPEDIIDADRQNLGNNEPAIQRQNWDISVKSLAHYPSVVHMMAQDPNWTGALGQAYVYQPQDVMNAVQYLRQRAWDNGVLRSSKWLTVSRRGTDISIFPVQGDYLYVPQYDPDVVYLSRKPNYGPQLLTFGAGFLIGSWLDDGFDWDRDRIYRHDWDRDRDDWFGRWSRNHRIDRDDYYLRDRGFSIVGNHDIIRRPVDFGKVRTFRLPGVFGGPPLNYPQGWWNGRGGENRGGGDERGFGGGERGEGGFGSGEGHEGGFGGGGGERGEGGGEHEGGGGEHR